MIPDSIFSTFAQQLVNGLTLGSIYALIALGYTLVYGILLMINFAHSEIFMIGAYAALASFSWPWIQTLPVSLELGAALLFAMGGSALLAFLVEKSAYRPLRFAPRLSPLISAIGVSIILQNLIFLFVSHSLLQISKN